MNVRPKKLKHCYDKKSAGQAPHPAQRWGWTRFWSQKASPRVVQIHQNSCCMIDFLLSSAKCIFFSMNYLQCFQWMCSNENPSGSFWLTDMFSTNVGGFVSAPIWQLFILNFGLTLLIKACPFPKIVISSAPLSESAKFCIIHLGHQLATWMQTWTQLTYIF